MKFLGLLVFLFGAVFNVMACSPHDEQYFTVHPKLLQEAIAECPDKAPKLVNCDNLHKIAVKVNDFVYELRMSPQAYGKTILALQETIATQELAHQPELAPLIEKNKKELRERLAVVSWLESPVN